MGGGSNMWRIRQEMGTFSDEPRFYVYIGCACMEGFRTKEAAEDFIHELKNSEVIYEC